MRLTYTIREAFVTSVMADVPSIDYDQLAQDVVRAHVKKLFDEQFPGVDFSMIEKWADPTYLCMPGTLDNFNCIAPWGSYAEVVKKVPEISELLFRYSEGKLEQAGKREALREKLKGIVQSCSTTDKLAKALPEFAKYLPTEAPKGANLPALANVVTEFMQAGWPKPSA